MRQAYLKTVLVRLERLVNPGDFVALCGSLPPGAATGSYAFLIERLRRRGARILLDTDGEPLREGIKAAPSFIKPNLYELSRIVRRPLRTIQDRMGACRGLLDKGLEGVLLSMGKEGACLVSRKGIWFAKTPHVKVNSTIGAGDALIGGFLLGLSRRKDIVESLRWGMACGTATAMTPATELCHRKDVKIFLKRITIKAI